MTEARSFEAKMRRGECFHNIRIPLGVWIILRLDGNGFTKFTSSRYQKPFDIQFNDSMVMAARAILERFAGVYAYTQSDEISVLLPRGWDMFDREVEKTVSLSAAVVSSWFSQDVGSIVQFDSRIWVGAQDQDVIDYFRWRQADATRNALNSWCYWKLRQAGESAAKATSILHGESVAFKNELLHERFGINFNEVPAWQRRGTGFRWKHGDREGFNPITKQTVTVQRRAIHNDHDLPMKQDYTYYLQDVLAEYNLSGGAINVNSVAEPENDS